MRYASHSVSTGTAQAPKLPPVKATIRTTVARPNPGRKAKLHANAVKRYKAAHAPAATDPNQSLIDAATNTRFGPQEQSYSQALGQNQSFSQGIPTWFANAMTEISGLQTQGQKNSADTLARVQSYNSQPATGTALDQQAATSRNNLNAQFATMLGRDAQSNSDYMDRMRAAYAAQQNNQLASAAQDRTKLLTGVASLKGQEGDYRTTYGSQLQAAEQKAAMDQANLAVKQGTLAYLTGNAQSLAKDRTAGQKVARSGVRIKRTGQADTRNQNAVKNAVDVNKLALDAYKLAHPKAGKGKSGKSAFTPTQTRKAGQTFRTLSGQLDENQVRKDPQGAIDALVKGKNVDPAVAKAIVESIYNNGSVTRDTATAYYRATGHHLHVTPKAKQPPASGGQVLHTILNAITK